MKTDKIPVKMSFTDLLNVIPNPTCLKGCNKEKRKEIAEDDLCKKVDSVLDRLPVRCVREHAVRKIHFLIQYFGIFATGMYKKWPDKINYIEICSGPGRCINRTNGEEFNGTALAILEHRAFQYVKKALFFDADKKVIQALSNRIHSRNISNAFVLYGDYIKDADICMKLKNDISSDSLNLVFIDPTDCSVPFQLIRSMKEIVPNMDLIINVASGTDFNRNIGNALMDQVKYKKSITKYAKFLNGMDFFENPENLVKAQQGKFMELRNVFRECYRRNLEKIGYRFFEFNSIASFYDLLFATSHKKGIEFWEKATRIRFDGQRKLL